MDLQAILVTHAMTTDGHQALAPKVSRVVAWASGGRATAASGHASGEHDYAAEDEANGHGSSDGKSGNGGDMTPQGPCADFPSLRRIRTDGAGKRRVYSAGLTWTRQEEPRSDKFNERQPMAADGGAGLQGLLYKMMGMCLAHCLFASDGNGI
ncbi:hypothetical protein CDD82_2860 [Ophiocordyceps australis]|uniref:Uncharacterized protein n=1 Tax=Ophiocordyceps australis TaxID=1399860 RepID=A0A2C5ZA72_9HYPO|nr:hypothetical protein CDD82_2860 [Ophiocordyceps australis]